MDLRERARRVGSAVASRFGLDKLHEHVLERRVAETPWYHADGSVLMVLLGVLMGTGVFLTLEYSNSPDHAYESVVRITEQIRMGWLVRALHYWSAGGMAVMLVFHLLRQILVGGYKAPREGTWTIGVALLVLVSVMAFTGYVLRWDMRALYALKVVLGMFQEVPLVGDSLVAIVQGGREIGAATLSRFFSVHAILVPALLLAFVAWHMYLVILHGVTSRIEQEVPVTTAAEQKKLYKEAAETEEHGEHFHPETVLNSGATAFAVFAAIFAVAVLAGPPPLHGEATLADSALVQEEWWFWWYSSVVALLPRALVPVFVVGFPLALLAFLLLLPLVDRGPNRGPRNRPVFATLVAVLALALFALSSLRVGSPWTAWPSDAPPPLPLGVEIPPEAEEGRQLFARYGCNSCHAVAGRGARVGPDFARTKTIMSPEYIRGFILQPPAGSGMPSYAGRLSDQELQRLVDFCTVAQGFPRE